VTLGWIRLDSSIRKAARQSRQGSAQGNTCQEGHNTANCAASIEKVKQGFMCPCPASSRMHAGQVLQLIVSTADAHDGQPSTFGRIRHHPYDPRRTLDRGGIPNAWSESNDFDSFTLQKNQAEIIVRLLRIKMICIRHNNGLGSLQSTKANPTSIGSSNHLWRQEKPLASDQESIRCYMRKMNDMRDCLFKL
jgi:hypothetical protein